MKQECLIITDDWKSQMFVQLLLKCIPHIWIVDIL